MPTMQNLTINDGQTTPAAHTFAVANASGSSAEWAEKTAGILNGYYVLKNEVRKPQNTTGALRNISSLVMPTTATVDGSLKVVRSSSAQVVFNFAQDATDQERKDLVAYTINYLSNAVVKPAIIAGEPFF